MDPVGMSGSMTTPEIYAMKQATKVQERAISQILEGLQQPLEASSSNRSDLTSEELVKALTF